MVSPHAGEVNAPGGAGSLVLYANTGDTSQMVAREKARSIATILPNSFVLLMSASLIASQPAKAGWDV
jgi:hypothetical protein